MWSFGTRLCGLLLALILCQACTTIDYGSGPMTLAEMTGFSERVTPAKADKTSRPSKVNAMRLVPEHCTPYLKDGRWGFDCNSSAELAHEEDHAKYRQSAPHELMPGHPSSPGDFVPSTAEDPHQCQEVIYEYTTLNSYTRTILDNIQRGRVKRTLTATAAYHANNTLENYYKTAVETARRKYSWSERNSGGDAACTAHIRFAISEHRRVGGIINAEIDKGNRDLAGTGLNPYTSEYNR